MVSQPWMLGAAAAHQARHGRDSRHRRDRCRRGAFVVTSSTGNGDGRSATSQTLGRGRLPRRPSARYVFLDGALDRGL